MPFLLCLLSAVLLTISFPQIQIFPFSWIALVPLLNVLDGQKPWVAFKRAYLCGFLFFAATIGWIVYVTYPGAILLVAFLSLYFAVFGALFVYFQPLASIARIFVLSASWVGLEFIRAHLFSGFGWVMLGHAQYQNFWLIQIADITGVYGVSFLVILVNLLIFENWRARKFLYVENFIVLTMLSLAFLYGYSLMGKKESYPLLKIGVVQPNIPLAVDWDESKKPWIIQETLKLTHELDKQQLDLIIWPETSLPGTANDPVFLDQAIQSTAAKLKIPMLIGSVTEEGEHFYNSAYLIGADGQVAGRYDKIHLVPFGEYLPLRPLLGWINKFVELDDFTSGKDYKVFSIEPSKAKFSTLICFEDTLGNLRRKFARQGADLFVNMTNDAWFRDTKEPFLHLQSAVFGCVENHRSLARAANTGISALVDPWGRIISMASSAEGKKTFVEAVAWGVLPLNHKQTFYTKYGDVFTYLCFLCILVAVVIRK